MDTLTQPIKKIAGEVEETIEKTTEAATLISDTISAATHQGEQAASIETGQPTEVTDVHTDGSTDDMLSCSMSVDFYKENFTKLVHLSTFQWNTTNGIGHRLDGRWLPNVFFQNFMPTQSASQLFSYLRCGYHFRMLVNASPGVLGSLICVYIPGGYCKTFDSSFPRDFKSVLSLPHTILDVRCSNQADLVVPYANYTNYVHYTKTGPLEDGAMVCVYVFAKMEVGSGFSGEIDVSLYGELIEADFQAPRPINQGRPKRRQVKPPPKPPVKHHTMVDGAPGCCNLSNVESTGTSESLALVGESTAIDYATAGCSSNINDFIEIMRKWVIIDQGVWENTVGRGSEITALNLQPYRYGNMGLILGCFQFFRGSFEIKVLTYASPLATARYQITWFPEYYETVGIDKQRNGVYLTADIGCESGTLVLPFTSSTWRRQCDQPYGRITMSCINKIAYNTTAPNKVSYKILMRVGPDFQVFCPRLPVLSIQGLGDGSSDPVLFINYEVDHIPIQSQSHSNVNALLGRIQHYGKFTLTAATINQAEITLVNKRPYKILETVAYWSGELLFSILNHCPSPLYFAHKYTSYNFTNQEDMMAHGVILIPANGMKTINIPFYSDTPLRRTIDNFGRIALLSKEAGQVEVNIAFRKPSFFFPIPCTSTAQATSYVKDLTIDGDVESNPGPQYVRQRIDLGEEYIQYEFKKWRGLLVTNKVLVWSLHKGPYPSPASFTCYEQTKQTLWKKKMFIEWELDYNGVTYWSRQEIERKWNFQKTCREVEGSYVKDLTEEGIEPNPGPADFSSFSSGFSSVTSRAYGENFTHYWQNNNYTNGYYTTNLTTVHAKSNGIPSPPVFTAKVTTTASWFTVKVRVVVSIRTHQGWKMFRAKFKLNRMTFARWNPIEFQETLPEIVAYSTVTNSGTRGSQWTVIRSTEVAGSAVSLSKTWDRIDVRVYPTQHTQPYLLKIGNAAWVRDLTEDGDVEENPGPTQWLCDRDMIHARDGWMMVDTYILVKKNGDRMRMVGPLISVIKTKLNDGRSQVEYRWRRSLIHSPESVVYNCHESCWNRDLTIDGDVELNPGPRDPLPCSTVERKEWEHNGVLYYYTKYTKSFRWFGHVYEGNVSLVHVMEVHPDNRRKDTFKLKDENGQIYDWVFKCHEKCWQKDPTQDGDVEQNPGPYLEITTWRVGNVHITEHCYDGGLIIHQTFINWSNGAKKEVFIVEDRCYEFKCHEHCWVRDLTMDGDVEENPGPWSPDTKTIMVLGATGSGKSYAANKILGKEAFIHKLSTKSVTYCDQAITHGNLTVIDTAPLPKLTDFVSGFVYVHKAGRFNAEEKAYLDLLDKMLPNWQAHAVLLVPQREVQKVYVEDYIKNHKELSGLAFKMMGRITDSYEIAKKMICECLPSPYFSHHYKLVYKNRGAYRHYGVLSHGRVFHLNTADILKSALSGSASVQVDHNPQEWIKAEENGYRSALYLVNAGAIDLDFNFDSNCETWAKTILGSDQACQGHRLKWCLTLAAAAAFMFSGVHIEDQSPGLFSKIITSISGHFYKNLECVVIKTVIRTVCRILCYLILYCHSPNLLTTGVIIALISMDVTSIEIDARVKAACESLANGEFAQFCSDIIDLTGDPDYVDLKSHIPQFTNKNYTLQRLQQEAIHGQIEMEKKMGPLSINEHPDNCDCYLCSDLKTCSGKEDCYCPKCRKPHNQGPKSFNDWTTAAKNVKWWIESLMKWFEWLRDKIFPQDAAKKIAELELRSAEIATVMALADEHICKCRTNKNYVLHKDTPKKHAALVDRLLSFHIDELPSQLSHLQQKLNNLLTRLQNINIEPPLQYAHRVEPLGIWIQGAPGCGKSFLSHYIVKELQKRYGWEPYSHPIGSEHMDGYTDQEIHIFDDLGQNREEEDVGLMCNLISSVPFIVPKAALESKGCQYNGKVVIATTNKRDFTTNKLLDSGALQRRFPIILEIRPREKYRRDDACKWSKFNAVNATGDGSLMRGECWEINVDARNTLRTSEHWQHLNPQNLMDEIFQEIDSRLKVCNFMNQGKCRITLDSDEPDMLSDMFPEPPKNKEKFVQYVSSAIGSFKEFVDRNRTWFVAAGALGTIISLASITIPYVKKWMAKDATEEENFYGGKVGPLRLKDYKLPLHNQGPLDMKSISKLLVTIEDEDGDLATGLAIGDKTVVTFGHENFKKVVCFRDTEVNWEMVNSTQITINGDSMDLRQYDVKSDIQFKSVNHKIYGEDYHGDGYLVWKEMKHYLYIPVTNIRPTSTIITQQGTTTQHTYSYVGKTWRGLCGALLVGVVNGNPKILGIHVAGNKSLGMAARLFPMFNQGKAKVVGPNPTPYYQPRKTKYEPSPVQQDEPTFGPAVLSNKDKRLEVQIEDITKHAAQKYIGNHFDPPRGAFQMAKSHVTQLLSQVLEVEDNMSFEQAVTSDVLPIDWQTSSGLKYIGFSKKQLVQMESFKADVLKILEGGETFFTCYLKDELRPNDKVAIGKTRAIEAGNFDYVIAWRMVMGRLTARLFNDFDRITGFAPGLNPYVYWDSMMENVKESVIGLDFKNYDGSLSPQVMEAAVEVLACFHKQPELVKLIHYPTIYSTNLVSDEKWFVEGGMCSGSPCTTVLNTIVNLIVNYTVMFDYGYSPSELYIIGYGDDTVISADRKVAISDIASKYKKYFGMNVTSAAKTDQIGWQPKEKLEFLKRSTALFPHTTKIVGKLDLKNMVGHLDWTSGTFQEQLNSFYLELVLHGQEIYDKVRNYNQKKAPSYNHLSFGAAYEMMKTICLVY
nr:polyprotein [duck egg-reducing syndrome virus]